jgi:protein SCO1/2
MRLRRGNWLPLALGGLVLAALAFAVVATISGSSNRHGSSSPGTTGTSAGASGIEGAALPPGVRAPSFSLVEPSGRRISLSDFRGQVTAVAFLDSGCAPACVLVAQQIRGALDELRRPVPVVLISVDPAADTPARVAAFLRSVGLTGRAHYLSGPAAALPSVWRSYRITTPDAGRRAFESALTVILIDGSGHERVLFQQEQLTPESLAHDIGKLESG